ncbi:BET1-like protein [Pomacea canaliculata]|uniref:BET1-like protein n=1 Tax=Pomacea canaliculata TaxID=400727 RepID=UPI000D735655|nr:BET1-like protein [Pomacea canaliculata]
MADWSKARNGTTTEEILDNENQLRVEGLANKVSRLRGIALELESDSKDSVRYADGMVSDFGSAEGLLTGTMNRLSNMVSSGRNNRRLMCYIILALVGLFIIAYYLISHVTAS